MVDSTDESEDTAVGPVDEDNLSDSSETSSSESSEVGEGGLLADGKGKAKRKRKQKADGVRQGESECLPEYMLFSQPLPQRMPCQCLLGTKWTVNFRRNLHSTLRCSQPKNARRT